MTSVAVASESKGRGGEDGWRRQRRISGADRGDSGPAAENGGDVGCRWRLRQSG